MIRPVFGRVMDICLRAECILWLCVRQCFAWAHSQHSAAAVLFPTSCSRPHQLSKPDVKDGLCLGHWRVFTSAGPQALCASAGLLHVLLAALGAAGPGVRGAPPLLTKWLCLCLGRLCQDMPQARPCCCRGVFAQRGGA